MLFFMQEYYFFVLLSKSIKFQQECAKKISAVEEEWRTKYEALQSSVGKASHIQVINRHFLPNGV